MIYFVRESHLKRQLGTITLKNPNSRYLLEHGWGNGYVLLPKNHPWYDMYYEEIPIHVHGGLTFGSIITKETVEVWGESLTEQHIGMYMIGFDTAHYNDKLINWPKKRVMQETQYLEKQVRNLGHRNFID